jgi:hypothetical protein
MLAVALPTILFTSQAEGGGRRCRTRCVSNCCYYAPAPCECAGTYYPSCASPGIDHVAVGAAYAVTFDNQVFSSAPSKAVLTFVDHRTPSIVRGVLTDTSPTYDSMNYKLTVDGTIEAPPHPIYGQGVADIFVTVTINGADVPLGILWPPVCFEY